MDFRALSKIKGAGTTTHAQSYEFIDKQPNVGMNYYRLRQVDMDGREEVLETLAIVFGENKGQINLFPTITTSEINLQFPGSTESSTRLRIFATDGREVKTLILEPGTEQQTILVNELPQGSYFLKFDQGTTNEVLKFIKK